MLFRSDVAYAAARRHDSRVLAEFDVNLDAFSNEAASVLALLLRGIRPDPESLAESLLDGLSPDIKTERRWKSIYDAGIQQSLRCLFSSRPGCF